MPVYMLEGERPKEFASRGIPATFVIGRDGTILFEHTGAAQWNADDVVSYFEGLILPAEK